MRVLVTGGRDFTDAAMVQAALDPLAADIEVLIEGGARGADTLAREWAKAHGIPWQTYEANWKRYGRRAGPIRNQKMLDEGYPDLVVAFPGGKGTADMVRRAREAGVKVMEYA